MNMLTRGVQWGRVQYLYATLPVGFCPLLEISLGNPYLKITDLSILFVADALMKRKKNSLTPSQSTDGKYGSENCPWVRGLNA